MTKSPQGIGMRIACMGLALSVAVGCGVAAEEGENLGQTSEALTFGAWQTLEGKPFGASGPTLMTKQQGNGVNGFNGSTWWASTQAYDSKMWVKAHVGSNWINTAPDDGWSNFGSATDVAAKPSTVSWNAQAGLGASMNQAIVWADWNGVVHFGYVAPLTGGLSGVWSNLSTTGFSTTQPGVAVAGGFLYVFAVSNADKKLYYKRANADASSVTNWSPTWSAVFTSGPTPPPSKSPNFVSGVSAVAVSTTKIALIGSPEDGSTACLAAALTVSSNTVGASWTTIANCQSGWNTPGVMPTGSNSSQGSSGARMVVMAPGGGLSTAVSTNGTSWSFTSVPMGTCATANSAPAITPHAFTGEFILATTCNGQEWMSWRVVSP